jgi:hypothetical protein
MVPVAIVTLIAWTHLRHPERGRLKHEWRKYGLLLLAGLAIMLFGFVPYLPTVFRDSTWRVFYLSSVGAALYVSTLIYLLSHIHRLLSLASAMILVAVAFCGGLLQDRHLADASYRLQMVLGSIVQQAPDIEATTTILLVDEAGIYQGINQYTTGGANSVSLAKALSYIYGHPIYAQSCGFGSNEICDFTPSGVIVKTPSVPNDDEDLIPYEDMVVFQSTWSGKVELMNEVDHELYAGDVAVSYHPNEHIIAHTPPARVYRLFTCWPVDSCIAIPGITQQIFQSEVRLDFDKPVIGSGWAVPESSHTWTQSTRTTLVLRLDTTADRSIQFRARGLTNRILDSMVLKVNGIHVRLVEREEDPGWFVFSGLIPQSVLARNPDWTELVFLVDEVISPKALGFNEDARDLGILFDWLEIY